MAPRTPALTLMTTLSLATLTPFGWASPPSSSSFPVAVAETPSQEALPELAPPTPIGALEPADPARSDTLHILVQPDKQGDYRILKEGKKDQYIFRKPQALTDSQPGFGFAYTNPSPMNQLGEIGKRRLTLHMEGVNAREAVIRLLKQADASYVISGDLPKEKRTVTFDFKNVPLADALGAVAEAAGLGLSARGSILILSPGFEGSGSVPDILHFQPMTTFPKDFPKDFNTSRPLMWPKIKVPGQKSGPDIFYDAVPNKKVPQLTPLVEPFSYKPLPPKKATITRETVQLRHLTVDQFFDKLDLPSDSNDTPQNWLRWRFSPLGEHRIGIPEELTLVEGEKGRHALNVEGAPDAIKKFRNRIERLNSDSSSPENELEKEQD